MELFNQPAQNKMIASWRNKPMARTEAFPDRVSTIVCSIAIAVFPLCGYTDRLNSIAQAISALAVVVGLLMLTKRVPSLHAGVLAFLLLLAFWGITVVGSPEVTGVYLRLLKMVALSLAAHLVFRTPKQLLLLLGIFGASGLIGVALNWGELSNLNSAFGGGEALTGKDRFAGTFGNANGAGTYATTTLLAALIFFLSSRNRLRWLVLLSGGLGGVVLVYFTGSRKAMLVLGLIALFVPALAIPKAAQGRIRWVLWALFSCVTIACFALLLDKLPYTERLLVQIREGVHAESSSDARVSMVTAAFELWKERPFFGNGFEGFAIRSGFGVYSHSTFSEVLCNGGLFGSALLGLFYLLPGAQLCRLAFSKSGYADRRLNFGLLALWAQFTVFSVFSVMWYTAENLCIYMAICGCLQESRLTKRAGVLLADALPERRLPTVGRKQPQTRLA